MFQHRAHLLRDEHLDAGGMGTVWPSLPQDAPTANRPVLCDGPGGAAAAVGESPLPLVIQPTPKLGTLVTGTLAGHEAEYSYRATHIDEPTRLARIHIHEWEFRAWCPPRSIYHPCATH